MKSDTLIEILESNYNRLSEVEKTIYGLYYSDEVTDQLIVDSYFKKKPSLKKEFDFLKYLTQTVNTSLNNQ